MILSLSLGHRHMREGLCPGHTRHKVYPWHLPVWTWMLTPTCSRSWATTCVGARPEGHSLLPSMGGGLACATQPTNTLFFKNVIAPLILAGRADFSEMYLRESFHMYWTNKLSLHIERTQVGKGKKDLHLRSNNWVIWKTAGTYLGHKFHLFSKSPWLFFFRFKYFPFA